MDNQEQTTRKPARLTIVILVLAVLLVLSAGGLTARYIYLANVAPAQATATVPDNRIGKRTQPDDTAAPADRPGPAEQPSVGGAGGLPAAARPTAADKLPAPKLQLYKGKPDDSAAFAVRDLFPGDSVTHYFGVKAYHSADLPLYFRAIITDQSRALGDVLHIKVTRIETGRVLCDAPFAEVNRQELSEALQGNPADETTATYRIDVSLDTSVGDEYQAAMLQADFQWYVKDADGLTPPPTGDRVNAALWLALAVSSLLVVLLLFRRRKGDGRHGPAN